MKLHLSPGMDFRKAIDGAKESLRKTRIDYNQRKKENEKAKSSNQN
jgi:hypothetical protein